MTISNEIHSLAQDLVPIRRSLHQNPQLGFQETFANSLVREKLEEWGIPYESGMAGTGVVATIESEVSSSGKMIGIRADMDALPIEEESDVEWKSRNHGIMHACGHDGHTSILLGTASWLQNNRDKFDGTVKLIFQPAEEGVGGARKMVAEGLFEKHNVDAIFALHNWPDLPLGKIGLREGAIMASYNTFSIDITGKSSHAAYPERGINAGAIAAAIYSDIHTRLTKLDLGERFVVAPTVIKAGDAKNIVPGSAVVHGSIRALSRKAEHRLKWEIEDLSHTIAASFGASASVSFADVGIPTINDPYETAFMAAAACDAVGPENVDADVTCAMTAEDFSYMLEKKPGTYIWLGQATNDKNSPHNQALHNNRYEFNDAALAPGIAVFTKLVQHRLPVPIFAP